MLCELLPGGVFRHITAGQAAQALDSAAPPDAVAIARCQLAAAYIEELRSIDARMRDARKKPDTAVRASGTSLTGLFGAGPVVAAPASAAATTSPPTTAPRRSRSPPATARSTG